MRTIVWRALGSAVDARFCLPSSCPKTQANGFQCRLWRHTGRAMFQSWLPAYLDSPCAQVPPLYALFQSVEASSYARGCRLVRSAQVRLRICCCMTRPPADPLLSNLDIRNWAAKAPTSSLPQPPIRANAQSLPVARRYGPESNTVDLVQPAAKVFHERRRLARLCRPA